MSLRSLIEFLLLDEDILSDLVTKYPNLKKDLETAKNEGVPPKYLGWLAKILNSTSEPVKDIIPLLKTFEKKKEALKSKFGGNAADINTYKTAQELSSKLEQLYDPEKEKKKAAYKTNPSVKESDKLYEDNEWVLIMPESTAESCKWGANTTWCTARTQSQNLFLSYVARAETNIILFYLIKKGVDPREDPDSKISIGFINGEPQFHGQYGGVTVNAANDAVDEQKFYEILGDTRGSAIMDAIKQKAEQISGQHPAKTELKTLVANPQELSKKIDSFKNKEEKEDFIGIATEHVELPESLHVLMIKSSHPGDVAFGTLDKYAEGSSPPKNLIETIFSVAGERLFSDSENDSLMRKVISFKSTPEHIVLNILSTFEKYKGTSEQEKLLRILSFYGNATNRVVDEVLRQSNMDIQISWNLAANPGLSLESSWKLIKQTTPKQKTELFNSFADKTEHPEILQFLAQQGLKDPNAEYILLTRVLLNKHVHQSTIRQIFDSMWKSSHAAYAHYVLQMIARSRNTPVDILLTIARVEESQNYTIEAIQNPAIGVDMLRKLGESSDVQDRVIAAMNPITPTDILLKLIHDPSKEVVFSLIMGRDRRKLPPEVKQVMAADPKLARFIR